jgi:sortase A
MIASAAHTLTRAFANLLIAGGIALLALTAVYHGYGVYQAQRSGLTIPATALSLPIPREPPPLFEAPEQVAAPVVVSSPAVRISIPSIDVDAPVVELGTIRNEKGELVWETAKHAVGHHIGTANPGDRGNVVMSGHISSPVKREGNVFSRLPELQVGEAVVIQTAGETYYYRISDRRVVDPSEISVMNPTATPVLTLITCFPDWVYSHRLVVTGVPVTPG